MGSKHSYQKQPYYYKNRFMKRGFYVHPTENGKFKERSKFMLYFGTFVGFMIIWLLRGKKRKARYLAENFRVTYGAAYKLLKEEKTGFITAIIACSQI